jgi:histidinol phosphatase-like enzyme (inositol monophosphatase family)
MPSIVERRSLLDAAVVAAKAAEGPLRRWFRQRSLPVEMKGDGSPVSQADQEAEQAIRAVLRVRTPGVAVLGEEGGEEGTGSLRWVVDPLDGTQSFTRGIPLWGTLIGLEKDGEPILGVIHLPMLGETYQGGPGLGATRNGERIDILGPGARDRLEDALIATGDPRQFLAAECMGDHPRVMAMSPFARGYPDCFAHALAAAGSVNVMVDPALAPWDIVATRAVVTGAGGAVRLRRSRCPGKVDVIMGHPALVDEVWQRLGW